MHNYSLAKLFSIYFVFIPIIQYYVSPVPNLNLATFLAVVFGVLFFINNRGKMRMVHGDYPLIIFVFFITFSLIFHIISNNDFEVSSGLAVYARTIILIVCFFYLGSKYFNVEVALSTLEILLLSSTVLMFIQLFTYYVLHNGFVGNITFFLTDNQKMYAITKLRVSGFYMEPAAFSQSATLYLCATLFRKTNISQKEWKKSLFVVLGIILSGSGQGYVYIAFLAAAWLIILLYTPPLTNKKIVIALVFAMGAIIFSFITIRLPYVQTALSRIITENDQGRISLGGQALSGRSYTNKYFTEMSLQNQWVGVGIGNIEKVIGKYYVNSLFYYLFEFGYVALPILLLMLLIVFIRGDRSTRVFLCIYAFMIYCTGCARTMMLCYYFMFFIHLPKRYNVQKGYITYNSGLEKEKDHENSFIDNSSSNIELWNNSANIRL